MWIRISEISVKKMDANHLENPKNPGSPMALNLFQREYRTAFYISKNKKLYPQYLETPSGTPIPTRKWTDKMKDFAQTEIEKMPLQKGLFKMTIFGWLFFLFAFGTLGYLIYDGVQAPAKMKKHQEMLVQKETISVGDIFFGHYEVYKKNETSGIRITSGIGFGWFKVVKIENDIYYLAKGKEMSKSHKPGDQLNSTDFETETTPSKIKENEAYSKRLISNDGNTEFYFLGEKKTN